jgi:hypothetical protein
MVRSKVSAAKHMRQVARWYSSQSQTAGEVLMARENAAGNLLLTDSSVSNEASTTIPGDQAECASADLTNVAHLAHVDGSATCSSITAQEPATSKRVAGADCYDIDVETGKEPSQPIKKARTEGTDTGAVQITGANNVDKESEETGAVLGGNNAKTVFTATALRLDCQQVFIEYMRSFASESRAVRSLLEFAMQRNIIRPHDMIKIYARDARHVSGDEQICSVIEHFVRIFEVERKTKHTSQIILELYQLIEVTSFQESFTIDLRSSLLDESD